MSLLIHEQNRKTPQLPIDRKAFEIALEKSKNTPFDPEFDDDKRMIQPPKKVKEYRFDDGAGLVTITSTYRDTIVFPLHNTLEIAEMTLNGEYRLGLDFSAAAKAAAGISEVKGGVVSYEVSKMHHNQARKLARDNDIDVPDDASADEVRAALLNNREALSEKGIKIT